MQATRQNNKLSASLGSSWRTVRGLTLVPDFLPPTLPSKDFLVDLANFPSQCSNDEASTRFSAFLFAKAIPKDQDPDQLLGAYAEKLSLPPLETPQFKSALSNYLIPTFRRGWDRNYGHEVASGILSNGKTVEGIECSDWDLPSEQFRSYCLGDLTLPGEVHSSVKRHKAIAIFDSGKYRLVTLGSKWLHLLAPLHRLIYSVLTRKGTVLRGTPLPSTFQAFPRSADPICSGDYEASTDNLSSAHALHILQVLQQTSTHVPPQIWRLAFASLTGFVKYETKDGKIHSFDQRTGQLMGNYLSFPLLCISNISTIFLSLGSERAWRMIGEKRLVVNGDDIVYQACLAEIEKWKKSLPLSGFVVNESKTGVHRQLFTLNSKLFRSGRKRVRKIWHLIPKGVFKKVDVTKHVDVMAAHAAIVRENVKGAPQKVWARTVRALASVKKKAIRTTSIKRLAGASMREYEAWPRDWKVAERIKSWDVLYNPLRERVSGGVRIRGIRKEVASDEQVRNSPYVCADARFGKVDRESVIESNDRDITGRDWADAWFFLYQKIPDYRRANEELVWIRDDDAVQEVELTFVKFEQ